MPDCHLLLARDDALDLLDTVDQARIRVRSLEVLTLLLLDLVVARERLTARLFPDLPEAPS